MADYIVHKAVSADKARKAIRDLLTSPGYLEVNYIAQRKYDGCNMVAVVTSEGTTLLSRTGEEVRSLDHIKHALNTHPDIHPGVYLGEAWAPDLTFAEISGLFRRHVPNEDTCRIQFAIFDILTLDEWESGESTVPYADRCARAGINLIATCPQRNPIWLAESFGYLAETYPLNTAQDVCNKLVEVGGYDGLILRDPEGGWRKGDRGNGGEIIKIKRMLSFDLLVIGREEGRGKHAGRLGALIVEFNGKELRVGTGFTDKERTAWWAGVGPIGRIVEIEAMDYSEDGLLREPRFKGIRHDKLEADA